MLLFSLKYTLVLRSGELRLTFGDVAGTGSVDLLQDYGTIYSILYRWNVSNLRLALPEAEESVHYCSFPEVESKVSPRDLHTLLYSL